MKKTSRCGALVAVLLSAASAQADDKQACVDSFNAGQDLRSANKLVESRKKLLECARDTCPQPLRADCVNALNEVQASLPTVVFSAVDAAGKDRVAVKVSADGQVVQETLEGKAVMLTPGVPQMKYETEGSPPLEDRVVVRAGEKNRLLKITFGGGATTSPTN